MGKKVLVTKEFHAEALRNKKTVDKIVEFFDDFQVFLLTELSPSQQKEVDAKINEYIDNYGKETDER